MNAGIIIFETIYEILGQGKSIVFDDGLREGVAINATL
jgi:exopolyphosphatase/pppGpp-phosphohydrolase